MVVGLRPHLLQEHKVILLVPRHQLLNDGLDARLTVLGDAWDAPVGGAGCEILVVFGVK